MQFFKKVITLIQLIFLITIVAGIPPVFALSFTAGDLFISSSVTDEIQIYDSETLDFKGSFSHELFKYGNYDYFAYAHGPNGIAFNGDGNLVVSSFTHFIEFSSPGTEVARYEKKFKEANEHIIFDALGNMYSTTSTGGSDRLIQYQASDYNIQKVINLPPGAASLTGITFDDKGRLYVASQSDNKIHVLQASDDFSVFEHSHSIDAKNAGLEGLAFNQNGELLALAGDIDRYNPDTGELLGSFDVQPDTNHHPHAITVDDSGEIYVADFEFYGGIWGGKASELIRFNPDGSSYTMNTETNIFGPFSMAIAGTDLPGGPSPTPEPNTLILFGIGIFGFMKFKRRFE
ncbi:MAG: PEP-CTERM sorting domain-containing protein [Desulfobacteraceae bacterium]|nr:PEP-CTERM sorting domain-containing protein [Desulfobacteraceae bacterium]